VRHRKDVDEEGARRDQTTNEKPTTPRTAPNLSDLVAGYR